MLYASFMLASHVLQAQIYPFKSAERVVPSVFPDSTHALERAVDERTLLTSYNETGIPSAYFLRTTQGTNVIESVQLMGIRHVSDFKILGDWLFFCGQYVANNNGFVAWTQLDELFDPATTNIKISVLPNVPDVTKIDAYEDGQYKYAVVAIGSNQRFIHTGVETNNYSVYISPFPLSDVVVTNNHAVVLGKISLNNLAMFSHEKVNIQNYHGRRFNHKQARFENFLIESLFDEEVLVSYTDCEHYYEAQFIRIDAASLLPLAQQSLIDEGKPNPKEMVFNRSDSTILYLSHAVKNQDMITMIKPYEEYTYMADIVMPNMCEVGHETLNSLTHYNGTYLSAVGIDATYNNLYWFDYQRELEQGGCFQTFQEKVVPSNTFQPAAQQFYIGNQVFPLQIQTIQIQHSAPQYNIICND